MTWNALLLRCAAVCRGVVKGKGVKVHVAGLSCKTLMNSLLCC